MTGIKRERVSERLRTQLFYHSSFECGVPRCREDVGLEVHHIDFDPSNNSVNNLIVLCPNHHTKAHTGELSQNELRVHQAEQHTLAAAKWQKNVVDWKSKFPAFNLLPDWDTVLAVRKVIWQELKSKVKNTVSTREIGTAMREITRNYFSILDKNIASGGLKENQLPIFISAELVAFPDAHGEYPPTVRRPGIPKGNVPVLIRDWNLKVKEGETFVEGGRRFKAESLPLSSGFICGEKDGLPCCVKSRPSRAFYGSYYWVLPFGLRAITKWVWFWNPIEARFGTAAYFSADEGRPYIGALLGKRLP